MTVRLGIAGACGRMGQRIGVLASNNGEFKISGALEKDNHPQIQKEYGHVLGLGDLGVKILSDARQVLRLVDVLVDFSLPEGIVGHVQAARELKKPFVIGTTGLGQDQMNQIQQAAKEVACVVSPNMSPGINVLLGVVGAVGKALGSSYDIEISETHHRMKKDAPSGTALKLAEVISHATGRPLAKAGKARSGNEIGIHAMRGGDVVGDHTIVYAGDGELIEITHRATSRDTFALGALRAAKFVAKAKPGLYSMADVMREKI